eukprot:CAMPEP_0194136946 /NCGR_PEP_ID=MMETSP0152-20130528/6880_1 /TAXON_ID=1049557 /ORGANISM="Thalassiothrix antarctica, Strain L6-D1" /LENGTH=257 /DNA_ID=CAMNT_0038833779 /DNA_START=925 /DNA_END=1695 /DNA_ORIENTATION=-
MNTEINDNNNNNNKNTPTEEKRSLEEDNARTTAKKSNSFRLLLDWYGTRLFGTSAVWFLWDVTFYGNKLFQSTFLLAISSSSSSNSEGTSLLSFYIAATMNAFVAVMGYIGAAFLLDTIGRYRLQQYGLFVVGTLFLLCGYLLNYLPSWCLILLYFTSSFVGQLGPNATTFIIPAEIFPTKQRTLCHGIAAASGKVGALFAAMFFHRLPRTDTMFLVCGYLSFLACCITFYTIPNNDDNGKANNTKDDPMDQLDREW